jgi:flavin-dependent dehydrogenase
MNLDSVAHLDKHSYDVVICGGGLAGLTLARQLRRQHPALTVLVVEKIARPLPDAAHKVGESSVELGSQYFESLGLVEYLKKNHLFKHGLRFYPGGGHLPIHERMEIGAVQEPIVPSYQLDRGRFENDLRAMVDEDGATLLEGVSVEQIELGKGRESHRTKIKGERGDEAWIESRWLVDASGRAALVRREQKLTRGSGHSAHSGWFRVKGKVDITQFAPPEATEWHEASWAGDRWRSTNHLMGEGYWAWIIPLSTGNTSIGLVVHDPPHAFEEVRTLERVMGFLEKHEPHLHEQLARFEVMDFKCLRSYSHNVARGWSGDRWALVGEAGAFVDPLYSPGSDFIAYANCFTEEMIRADYGGASDEQLEQRARELSMQYRSFVGGSLDIYRQATPLYGHGRGMLAKIYWDNFSYWSYPCHYFLQELYRLTGPKLEEVTDVGKRFVQLSNYVQTFLTAWATLKPELSKGGFAAMPKFPSVLVDAHLALQNRWNPEETLAYMRSRLVEAEEVVGELLLRTVYEIGDELLGEFMERTGAATYDIRIPAERVDEHETVGLERRRTLSPIARDIDRGCGQPNRVTSKERVREALAPLLALAETEQAARAQA